MQSLWQSLRKLTLQIRLSLAMAGPAAGDDAALDRSGVTSPPELIRNSAELMQKLCQSSLFRSYWLEVS